MRIDLYTKAILTIIALLLAVIALKPLFQPQPAMAQGNFSSVQFSSSPGGLKFFDTRTGEIWLYQENGGQMYQHFKITQLGKPVQR